MIKVLRPLPQDLSYTISTVDLVKQKSNKVRAHRVMLPSGAQSWTVLSETGIIEPADTFLDYATLAGRSANTVRAYAYDLALWFRFLFAFEVEWDSVDLADLGRFASWLQRPAGPNSAYVIPIHSEPRRARSTVDRNFSTVFRFYDFHAGSSAPIARQMASYAGDRTVRDRVRSARGGRGRRPIRITRSNRSPATLDTADCERLLAACNSIRDRLLLSLWWTSGLRLGQTLGLRHEDFDGRRRQIRIVRRENENDAWAKNRKQAHIPITDDVVLLHREYMFEEYMDIDSDYVFVVLEGPTRGHPLSQDTVQKMVRRLRKRAGVEFTPHMLRHTFATEFMRNGGRLEALSEMLTHSSTESTRVYLHLTADDIRRELEKGTGHEHT